MKVTVVYAAPGVEAIAALDMPAGATVAVVPQALSPAGTVVIKLPTSALRQEGKGTSVWVLDRATMTFVGDAGSSKV